MGTYLNPGYQRFLESLNSEIFVDKTEMISYINSVVNSNQKYLSVSRPRRFGKSMAANMLCAYYGRGADLGYLGYDSETGEVFIPNREILDEFQVSTSSDEWEPAMEAFKRSQRLLQATWNCDAEKVADLLEQAHDQAGNKTYNNVEDVT